MLSEVKPAEATAALILQSGIVLTPIYLPRCYHRIQSSSIARRPSIANLCTFRTSRTVQEKQARSFPTCRNWSAGRNRKESLGCPKQCCRHHITNNIASAR